MPLAAAHLLRRLGKADVATGEHRPGVALPEGRKALDLLHGPERKLAQGGLGIDADLGDAVFFGNFARDVFTEGLAEGVHARLFNRQPGRTLYEI